MGRMAGTGTAVGGTAAKALGCQLRWRFLGGPLQVNADDTKMKRKVNLDIKNKEKARTLRKCGLNVKGDLPGLTARLLDR